jgi:energy-coupling factor transport system permease protein
VLGLIYEFPVKVLKLVGFYVLIGIVIVAANAISSQRGTNVLFEYRDSYVTVESIVFGILSAAALISIMIMFISFNKIVTQDRFLFIFSKVFPTIAFILMMTLRWIPYLKRLATEVTGIRKIQGMGGKTIGSTVFAYGAESSMMAAESMKSRGYGTAGQKRTFYFNYKFKKADAIFLIVELILIAANIIFFASGFGSVEIYKNFNEQKLFAINIFAFIPLMLFCLIPYVQFIQTLAKGKR